MPVLLSSRRIPVPQELEVLLPVALPSSIVAVVPNARDGLGEAEREAKVGATLSYLRDLGARTVLLDLRVADEQQVRKVLAGTHWCWAMGGDPSILRRAMSRSGFAEQIAPRLDAGYTYAGESAGAIVAGLSLRGYDVENDLEGLTDVDRSGLGLVPAVVLPHAGSTQFAEAIRRVRAANAGARFLEIGDGGQHSLP